MILISKEGPEGMPPVHLVKAMGTVPFALRNINNKSFFSCSAAAECLLLASCFLLSLHCVLHSICIFSTWLNTIELLHQAATYVIDFANSTCEES